MWVVDMESRQKGVYSALAPAEALWRPIVGAVATRWIGGDAAHLDGTQEQGQGTAVAPIGRCTTRVQPGYVCHGRLGDSALVATTGHAAGS